MVGDALCCNYIMQVSQLTDGSFKNKQDLNPDESVLHSIQFNLLL